MAPADRRGKGGDPRLGRVERDRDPAGTTLEISGEGSDVRLSGEKHFVLDAGAAETLFVVVRIPGTHCDEGLSLVAVDASASGLVVERPECVDLTRPVWTLRFSDTPRLVGSAGGRRNPPGPRRGDGAALCRDGGWMCK